MPQLVASVIDAVVVLCALPHQVETAAPSVENRSTQSF